MMWDMGLWVSIRKEMQVPPRGKPDVIAVSGIFAIHVSRVRFHLWKPVTG